ncbi:MAG: cobalt transporter [Halothiobacillus sp. 14-56-357]|jgi:Co/Zn/Cd efflux system component|nr:cation transporter [Halothiobacillus sp.]OZB55832.1 MAG: cobalt transporter [Halothiobacillus sp. 14-56-357]OZB77075.1 MAG: cobalt transporter [Halothiobacillus sp. 13-55-115]
MSELGAHGPLRRAVLWVALLNFSYFWVEFGVAQSIGSVSLFADSIDFLEDTAINLLILIGIGLSLAYRARLGMLLAGVLLIPGIATLWMAWNKVVSQAPPDAFDLSLTGLGALFVNLICAFLLVRFRHHQGSLTRAAFLSARNDALANVAIIAAGLLTLVWHSALPDLIVGLGIFLMNLDAAREVYQAARREHAETRLPQP